MNLEKTLKYLYEMGVTRFYEELNEVVRELNEAITEHSLSAVKAHIREKRGGCPLIVKTFDTKQYMFKEATYRVSVDFETKYVFNLEALKDKGYMYSYDTHNNYPLYISTDHPIVAGEYIYTWVNRGEECEECGAVFLRGRDYSPVCPTCRDKYKPLPYNTKAEELLGMEELPKKKNILGREDSQEIRFGIELEYEEVTAKQVNNTLKGHAIAKHDGSIRNGVEVVTRPACLKTHKDKLQSFYSSVKTKAASNTGMHVHVEKSKLSNYMIGFMMEFLNHKELIPHIETIAGRKYSSNTYCKPKDNVKMTWGNSFSEASYTITRKQTDKYSPLNTAKDKTIEIRIFSSPESHQECAAKLDFVNALVKYSSPYSVSVKRLQDKFNWDVFIAYIESNKKEFPDFVKHFIKKETV